MPWGILLDVVRIDIRFEDECSAEGVMTRFFVGVKGWALVGDTANWRMVGLAIFLLRQNRCWNGCKLKLMLLVSWTRGFVVSNICGFEKWFSCSLSRKLGHM